MRVASAHARNRMTSSFRQLSVRCTNSRTAAASFTLSPYADRPEGGYLRGSDFCLLTLEHPAFLDADTMPLRELYSSKAANDAEGVAKDIFAAYDAALNEEQLSSLIAGIGLPPTDTQIKGLIGDLAISADIPYQRSEFGSLLREVWDGFVCLEIRDDLHELYPSGAPFLAAQRRAIWWVGRASPASLLLLAARQAWPERVVGAKLMRNTKPNDTLDPVTMEEVPGMLTTTAVELAAAAAAQDAVAEGGLVVRMVVSKSDGALETVFVPLAGLPENDAARCFSVGGSSRRSASLWKYGPPALLVAGGVALFIWLESVRKGLEEERQRERASRA